ncbi:MAG TPA: hypothetical protein VGF94_02240 [Kofleriaceae bacterium]
MRLVGAVLLVAACGSHGGSSPPPPVDSNATFVALPATFQPFQTWTSFRDPGPADTTLPPTVQGGRTQYINMLPPHDSAAFPVGTVIVEIRDNGIDLASVKRGGDYNSDGAPGWEWFGLGVDTASGAVSVQWRGTVPPVGGYGSIPGAGCNECHSLCGAGVMNNDYVCSAELQLASF